MSVRDKLNDYIWDARETARRKEDNANQLIKHLDGVYNFYYATGVFFMEYENYISMMSITRTNPFEEFKERAKKDRRPFVMAVSGGLHHSGLSFTMGWNASALVFKRTKEVRTLYTQLLPLAETSYQLTKYDNHILTLMADTPGMCRFHFYGDKGKELFTEYLASFATDEDKMIVMNKWRPMK